MRRSRLGFLLVLGLLGSACSQTSETDASRDDDGNINENEDIGVFALREGDCLLLPSTLETEVETMEATPCSEPHDGEVLALVQVAGDDFPGQAALDTEAETGCLTAFSSATGVDFFEDVMWDMTYLTPTQESWDRADDREIVCIVTPLDGGRTTELVGG